MQPYVDDVKPRDSMTHSCRSRFMRPRSQTLFGNALGRETLFRKATLMNRANLRPAAETEFRPSSAFPNRVWERGANNRDFERFGPHGDRAIGARVCDPQRVA